MADFIVRGISEDKLVRLSKLAQINGYNSRNEYVNSILSRVAESNEVEDLDRQYRELQNRMMEQLTANTNALKTFVDIYGGED